MSRGRSAYKRVKRVERSIRRINRDRETKYFTVNSTLYPTTTSTTIRLDNITPGNDEGGEARLGSKIHATSMFFRWQVEGLGADQALYAAKTVRMLIVKAKLVTDASVPPTYSTIFNTSGTATSDLFNYMNWQASTRWSILYDKVVTVSGYARNNPIVDTTPALAASYWAPGMAYIRRGGFVKKKLGFNIEYVDNTNNSYKNALYLIMISDVSAGSTANYPLIQYNYRLHFTDS